MVAIFCRKGCLKSAEHLQSVRFAEAISFSACHRNVRFSTSNNKRRSEGRKSTSLYLTASNFNNKLCFIFVYLFVSWKDFFFLSGCFALIHNSQPFYFYFYLKQVSIITTEKDGPPRQKGNQQRYLFVVKQDGLIFILFFSFLSPLFLPSTQYDRPSFFSTSIFLCFFFFNYYLLAIL